MKALPDVSSMSDAELSDFKKVMNHWANQLKEKEKLDREKKQAEATAKADKERKEKEKLLLKAAQGIKKNAYFKEFKAINGKKVKRNIKVTFSFDLEGCLTMQKYGPQSDFKVANVKCDNKFLRPHIEKGLKASCQEILKADKDLTKIREVENKYYNGNILTPANRQAFINAMNSN